MSSEKTFININVKGNQNIQKHYFLTIFIKLNVICYNVHKASKCVSIWFIDHTLHT